MSKNKKYIIILFFVILLITLTIVIALLVNKNKSNNSNDANVSINNESKSEKNPLKGRKYTEKENKKIAEICYINSDNDKLNSIINNMFDAMVKKHTIQIETDQDATSGYNIVKYIDLIESMGKKIVDDELWEYTAYTDSNIINYLNNNESYYSKEILKKTRKELLYEMLKDYQYNLLMNPEKFDIVITENNDNYIIKGSRDKENIDSIDNYTGEEIYYINKNTHLLSKTVIDSFELAESNYYYTDEVISIPDDVFENAKEDYN